MAFSVLEGVVHPSAFGTPTADKDAAARMFLRENLRHVIISNKLSLVELREDPLDILRDFHVEPTKFAATLSPTRKCT